MKKFWKMVGAVMLGIVLLQVLGLVLTLSVVSSLGSSSSTVTEVPQNAILNVDMSELVIGEQTLEDDPFTSISIPVGGLDNATVTLGILDAIKALEAAAEDPSIRCLYLRPDMATDISHLEEFRAALVDFRTSGKPIYAYIEHPTNAGLYLASCADRVYMSSYLGGFNSFVGLSGRLIYYKDLLDRLGVNIQLVRHGKYKSAGEPYIRSTASAENLEQQSVMVNGLWKEIAGSIAEGREISLETLNALIDNLSLSSAQAFVDNKLVDELVTMDGMKEKLCAMTGVEKFKDVKSIKLADYKTLKVKDNFRVKDCIAVIYADGEIVDGRGTENVAGKRFADLIEEVRTNDDVKAVVLRVNSPGGSVVAASQIKDALDALKAEKTVIASYGSYAASGGYWISAGCEKIYSDATTLTGSIGVFGMIPEFGKAVKNLAHLNTYAINSNKHSDMYGYMRALTPEEIAFIQVDIEAIYTEFTSLVAAGRSMDVKRVDELGQGRVWTGRDAIANGLVDEIGGLKKALDYTATLAGLVDYRVLSYPRPLTMMENLMATLQPESEDLLVKGLGISEPAASALMTLKSLKTPAVYARLPYMIEIR